MCLECDKVCICFLNQAGKDLESVSPVFQVSSCSGAVKVFTCLARNFGELKVLFQKWMESFSKCENICEMGRTFKTLL